MLCSNSQRLFYGIISAYRYRLIDASHYRYCSSTNKQKLLSRAYAELGVDAGCSDDELKQRFVDLVKQLHPDAAGDHADPDRFIRITDAYRFIVDYHQQMQTELDDMSTQAPYYDINHQAPQHRQYLEYGGHGVGSPSQRFKQYQKHRVAAATESIHEHMINKLTQSNEVADDDDKMKSMVLSATKEQAYFSKRQQSSNTIERIVEDLIVQSMSRGDFTNLTGMGKPLKADNSNPYIDDMESRLNKILINNGFAPPWIMKEREIRDDIRKLRTDIRQCRRRMPIDQKAWTIIETKRWTNAIETMKTSVQNVNRAIIDYNLITPALSRQMFLLQFDRELTRAIAEIDEERGTSPIANGSDKDKNDSVESASIPK